MAIRKRRSQLIQSPAEIAASYVARRDALLAAAEAGQPVDAAAVAWLDGVIARLAGRAGRDEAEAA